MKVMLIDSLGIIGFNLVDFHLQEGIVVALIDAIFRCGSVANLFCLENKSAIFVLCGTLLRVTRFVLDGVVKRWPSQIKTYAYSLYSENYRTIFPAL